MPKIAGLFSGTAVPAGPGRFYGPRSIAEAARLMRARVMHRYPLIANLCGEIGRSGFVFGVDRGQDAVVYVVKGGETLADIRRQAADFAGSYGFKLHSDQTDPDCLPAGAEVRFYTCGRATGELARAKELIFGLKRRELESVFSHHLLDRLSGTPLDCLSLAFADLGIVREDFPQLNWTTAGAPVRNIRRWTFACNDDLAREIALAEHLLPASQPLAVSVAHRLYDIKDSLLERLHDKNARCWGLSQDSLNRAIADAFPFLNDPFFNDPREKLYVLCRRKAFEKHTDGAYLADVYARMVLRDSSPVRPDEVERAQQLILLTGYQQLERQLGISHHLGDDLRPRMTLTELFKRALAVILGDKLEAALVRRLGVAARRQAFVSHGFSEKFPKLHASLARMNGSLLPSEVYGRMFRLLVLEQAQTIEQLRREVAALADQYGNEFRAEHVRLYSPLAVRYSMAIFEIFGPGMTCDKYLWQLRRKGCS